VAQLADVARTAGVSKSTASRALARPEMVAEPTRKRVLDAAEKLNFQHNRAARALTTGRTGLIGLILPTLTNPYYGPLVLGAQHAAEEIDCNLLVAVSEHSQDREHRLATRLANQVDGLVIVALGPGQTLRRLADTRPIVLLERHVPGLPAVVVDTPAGLVALAEHLVAGGHRRIAYVSGPQGTWGNRKRSEAITSYLHSVGVRLTLLPPQPPTFDAGIAAADQIPRDVTAVIVYNSSVTLGVLHAFSARGIRVPDDIALASADDLALLGATTPSITALDLPVADAGRAAIDRLHKLLTDTRSPRLTTLPTKLVVRESTQTRPSSPPHLR
jgi:LacI family transcriptional regulator